MTDIRKADRIRAEKAGLLESMLGPQAMARIRSDKTAGSQAARSLDPNRVEWHKSQLLERLRSQKQTLNSTAQPNVSRKDLATRLKAVVSLDTLAEEHPSVIYRVAQSMERAERAELMRSLPGPVARRLLRQIRQK